MELLFTYAAAGVCIAAFSIFWKLILKQQNYLQGLCLGLSLTRFRRTREDPDDVFSWRIYSCDAQYQGRQIRVEYRFRPTWEPHLQFPLPFRAEDLKVLIPVTQKFWLRLLAERGAAISEEEVQIGIPDFDQAYLIHSNQPEAAREFLRGRLVQDQFRRLPAFARLEFHRGWLSMLIASPMKCNIRRSDLENALDALFVINIEYMQRSLSFKIVAIGSSALCPFCRCTLESAESTRDCHACGTRLHSACWKENGQCTTWGCQATG